MNIDDIEDVLYLLADIVMVSTGVAVVTGMFVLALYWFGVIG